MTAAHTGPDPRLRAGAVVRHKTGSVHIIRSRKGSAEAEGWWLHDGSGLSDYALTRGAWYFVAESVQDLADDREQIVLALIEATNPGIDMEVVKAERAVEARLGKAS